MLRIAVLIATCDKYSDVWRPLHQGMQKFVPELRWPVFCMIEEGATAARMPVGWKSLKVPRGGAWSANVAAAMEQLRSFDYVLMWIDDLIPTRRVVDGVLDAVIEALASLRPNYLRLNPTPGPRRASHMFGTWSVGIIEPGEAYRTSTVLAFWRPSVLLSLLSKGENAWQFEVFGSARSDSIAEFFGSTKATIPVCNLVIKGRVDPRALRELRRKCLQYSPARPLMNTLQLVRRMVQEGRSIAFALVPRSLRRRLHTALSAY